MVVAIVAVTIGCRNAWFVAAVAMPSVSLIDPTAPDRTPASFVLNRSEMNADPRPSSSARRTSSTRSRGESLWPAST